MRGLNDLNRTNVVDVPEVNRIPSTVDLVELFLAYEADKLNPRNTVALFSELISSGRYKTITGRFGIIAKELIKRGIFDTAGNFNPKVWLELQNK